MEPITDFGKNDDHTKKIFYGGRDKKLVKIYELRKETEDTYLVKFSNQYGDDISGYNLCQGMAEFSTKKELLSKNEDSLTVRFKIDD